MHGEARPGQVDRGLDAAGFVRREGHPDGVQPEFAALARDYVSAVRHAFEGKGLDGVYLYGSLPRGTACPGASDLDGQVLLDREPTEHDRAALDDLSAALAGSHPEVVAVEVLLHSRARMTDPALRYDEGFHIRVLCTPFWGNDAGAVVAPHRPDLELARHVQGDWRAVLRRLRDASGRASALPPEHPDAVAHRRAVGRRLARLAFTWVLPRWGGWTSDPSLIVDVVGQLEPAWRAPVSAAVGLGWRGRAGPAAGSAGVVADRATTEGLLDGFASLLEERGDELGA